MTFNTLTSSIDLSATRACACLDARRRARVITRMFEEYLRPHGLRSTQFSVLAALSLIGTPTPISRLARALELERTTLTRVAAVMERNGWLRTEPSEDGRQRRLALTEAGIQQVEAAYPAWQAAQARVERGEFS